MENLTFMVVNNLLDGNKKMVKKIQMDKLGRVAIPKVIRKALQLSGEQTLFVELRKDEIVLRPLYLESDPVKAIAKMNLPIAKWEEIEKQIGEGIVQD